MAHRIISAITKVFTKTHTDLYAPLDTSSHTIRLLQLLPGEWEDDIQAVLQERSIAEAKDRYITISYTWGHVDVVRQVSITCNGRSVLISENLIMALRKLRHPDRPILLWADALCINQADTAERTHQVGLMGKIYSNSRETIIWLGEPSISEDIGRRFQKSHSRKYSSRVGSSEMVWKGDSRDHKLRDRYLDDLEKSYTAESLPGGSESLDIFGAFCLIQDLAEDISHPVLKALDQDKANAMQQHGFRSTWHGLVFAKAHVRGSRSSRVWQGLERLMTRPWVHLPHHEVVQQFVIDPYYNTAA
jgi:hypothetical protein